MDKAAERRRISTAVIADVEKEVMAQIWKREDGGRKRSFIRFIPGALRTAMVTESGT